MRRADLELFSPGLTAEIEALTTLSEEDVDTVDISEQRDWAEAVRGAFFRPIEQRPSLLDKSPVDAASTSGQPPGRE